MRRLAAVQPLAQVAERQVTLVRELLALRAAERQVVPRLAQAVQRLATLAREQVLPQAAEQPEALRRVQRAAVRLLEEQAPVPRAPTLTMHRLEPAREQQPALELVRAPVDARMTTATAIRAARLPTTSRLCCRRCRAATALR